MNRGMRDWVNSRRRGIRKEAPANQWEVLWLRLVRRKEKHFEVALEVELANRGEQIVDGRALNLIVIELEVRGPAAVETTSSNRKKGILLIRARQQQTGGPVGQSQTRTAEGQDGKERQEAGDRQR